MNNIIIIGYGGHALVVIDIILEMGLSVNSYCDLDEKISNPYQLNYLGTDQSILPLLIKNDYFVSIGNNAIRRKTTQNIWNKSNKDPAIIAHPTASISEHAKLSGGVMVGANCAINALASIGRGVICNTGSIIEHECKIGDYAHIAPGAVLAGNVSIGQGSFVGAKSVIKEGVTIGKNSIIGAGSVVLKDIPDHVTYAGNPAKQIIK